MPSYADAGPFKDQEMYLCSADKTQVY